MARTLVVGYGSIGERHGRLLAELGHEVAVVSRRAISHSSKFSAVADAMRAIKPEYVVIANETSAHRSTVAALVACNFSGIILIEKPLFECTSSRDATDRANTYVGYALRFHPLIVQLREWVRTRRVVSASIHVGQNLSRWRPGRDLRDSYSAQPALGGGVLRDLSHELDYAIWLFGAWRRVAAIGGASGVLGIEADDHWSIVAEFDRCPQVSMTLSYLDEPPRRQIVVNTDSGTASVDLLCGSFQTSEQPEPDCIRVDRDELYRQQHQAILSGCPGQACTYGEGLAVVLFIEAIESAARTGFWIAGYR